MLRRHEKNDLPYYIGLVFLIFPIGGAFTGFYPIWTLNLTAGFLLSYLLLVRLEPRHQTLIAFLWFYTLAYVSFMTLVYQGTMMWFLFYHVNLLVWRFGDHYRSYRFTSFLIVALLLSAAGLIYGAGLATVLMSAAAPVFVLGMYYFQNRLHLQKKMEDEIVEQNHTINLLSAENERNRIGRDLHDTLGHTFAMMTLKTELALKQMKKGQYDAVRQQLEELNQISQTSMHEVREIVNNLKYQTVAEELSEIERLFGLSEIGLAVDNELDLNSLAPVTQSIITMILRELANNVIKHSQASQCQILIRRKKGIEIIFRDNGVGFIKLTGQELHSIRERLSLVEGSVEVTSSANPTIVTITLKEGGKQ
ncbi:sensor histidine kinase [Streptococcus macacae]|uniref:histidine kinase n=1 Tax=Streptococcus macacae NCTC 11558 TaxID=764298 RepID=G5JWK8_9STRE|nr:histidine kinase [Streptococcus macacae]EHJ52635.1 histidine kinase [Streptococcus macacae NCTC 11558]SUN78791.1 histidine kinase [Streptococcus macacae NCTC 11558]